MLLVDLGNSKIKLGILDIKSKLVIESSSFYKKDNLLEFVLAKAAALKVSRIFISSVLDKETNLKLVQKLSSQIECHLVTTQKQYLGFEICYEAAMSYGVDRWLSLVALQAKHPEQNLVVVTAGSAMTVDLVKNSQQQGGYILPGIYSSFNSLSLCDALPELNHLSNNTKPACSTDLAIQAGVSKLYQSFFKSLEQDYPDYQLIISGGDAVSLKSALNLVNWILDENLVLQGLVQVALDKELHKTFLV